MKVGLYTTRANRSCAGFAGSCQHEVVDVNEWAAWGVDYIKDDSCGSCDRPVEEDYRVMQAAIRQSKRSDMILTIEGGPNITEVHTGCCGQARRVGHDIEANWVEMISLVDQAAGLWPYAHNGSKSTVTPAQGFYNDLDMLELGNGEFNAENSPLFAAQARTHYSMWCVMKAVMLIGADLMEIGAKTLGIVKNAEAVAINQDPYGNQARRVAVQPARNTSLLPPWHALALLAPCNASAPLQKWRFRQPYANGSAGLLWTVDGEGNAWCLDSRGGSQSRWIGTPCDPAGQKFIAPNGGQSWVFAPATAAGSDPRTFRLLGAFTDPMNPNTTATPVQMGYPASRPGMDGVDPGYGASGPVQHTRWVAATVNSDMNAFSDRATGAYTVPDTHWVFNLATAGAEGSALRSTDNHIINDDSIGGTTQGDTKFCLELNSGSALEVWAAVLSPAADGKQRWVAALLNRSPSADTITLDYALLPDIGVNQRLSTIRDIWGDSTHSAGAGRFFSKEVEAHDTALLVLTAA